MNPSQARIHRECSGVLADKPSQRLDEIAEGHETKDKSRHFIKHTNAGKSHAFGRGSLFGPVRSSEHFRLVQHGSHRVHLLSPWLAAAPGQPSGGPQSPSQNR
jgi:hypothetical protein